MARQAYMDNNVLMAKAYLERDYSALGRYITDHKDEYSWTIEEDDRVYAYDIRRNEALSKIYGINCYVVKFLFSDIDSLHSIRQESILNDLCRHLKQDMEDMHGYFNLRIPSHILDLIRAYNDCFKGCDAYFCGGTVEEVQSRETEKEYLKHPEIKLFFADGDYLHAHRQRLLDLAEESFKLYQGQYHISPITSDRASEIYVGWIGGSIENSDRILIAEIDGEIAGYVTVRKEGNVYEGILSSVDPEYRRHSIYKSMISFIAANAKQEGGFFLSSTQLDNYIVQGTWSSLGMKPFYAIYNYHINVK